MRASLSLVLLLLGVCVLEAADDWPQFRGPTGQGHATTTGFPLTWSETENIAWKTPIPGRGWSSPVVLGQQIWMTTAVETTTTPEEREKRLQGNRLAGSLSLAAKVSLRAVCIDAHTGKLLHDIELFDIENPEPVHAQNSYASPTPIIEAGRLYCHFGTFGTACLDTSTGRILWKHEVPIEHYVGPGSSPIVHRNHLVLVFDGVHRQYVAAIDKRTGTPVWKTDRPAMLGDDGDLHKAFCTPLAIQAGGREQIVVPGAQWVVAYRPSDGAPIWQANYRDGFSNVPRPVFARGVVYICTGFMSPELWAIRADGRDDISKSHVLWKKKKQIPDRSSPVLVGDAIFVISNGGVATCFDASTGERHWRERVSGNYAASPVAADGRIYFFSQEGKTTVIEANKEYAKLATNQLDGRVLASPAFVDASILLRTATHLYRVKE